MSSLFSNYSLNRNSPFKPLGSSLAAKSCYFPLNNKKWRSRSLSRHNQFISNSTKYRHSFENRIHGYHKENGSIDSNTKTSKVRIAVDVDEVLGSFLATLNEFCAESYDIHHDVSEFFVYDFRKIWKCSQAEANHRVHKFFDSEHFTNGIPPIPGALPALKSLSAKCELVVVTSRQHVIQQQTLDWIDLHYPGIFKEVHFGNHFALEGSARPKSEICKSLGAEILIDDNPQYAQECVEHGIQVLLFDWNSRYPWSKTEDGPNHPMITRVKDWDEAHSVLLERLDSHLQVPTAS